MTAPGYQQVLYPVAPTIVVSTTQDLKWVFPAVPTAQAWTFGLYLNDSDFKMPSGNPNLAGDVLNLATSVFTLIRNGQPELTWSGSAILADVQALPSDQITVVCRNLGGANLQVNPLSDYMMTMRGYSQNPADYVPTSPKVYYTTPQAIPPTSTTAITSTITSSATGVAINFPQTIGVLGAVELSFGCSCGATGVSAAIAIQDATGQSFARQSVTVAPNSSQTGSVFVTLPVPVEVTTLQLALGNFAAATGRQWDAVAYFITTV